jgi:hypothetical protein
MAGFCQVMLWFGRELRYSAVLIGYLNSRIKFCYCTPMIWFFAPEERSY